MRLGWGGTYARREQEVLHAQREFLSAVEVHAPRVMQDLTEKPLEAFKAFYDRLPDTPAELGDASKRYGFIGGWEHFEYADEYTSPYRRNIQEALLSWARTHALEAKWVFDDALATLRTWCWARPDGHFHPIGVMDQIPYEPDFSLTIRYADLKIKTLEDEMKRFDDEYNRARDAYFAEAKTRYEEWGKEADLHLKLTRHLEIFVKYRCCDAKVPDLLKEYKLSRPTVYGILKDMCELLELPQVTRPSGRPSKQ